jgi:hypothetical protein
VHTEMPPTPALDKMVAVSDQSQAVGEFLEWLEQDGLTLARIRADQYVAIHETTEALLARYFDVDLDAAEREKRAILDAIRSA